MRIYCVSLSLGSILHAYLQRDSFGLKLLPENMSAHKKPDHELGSVVASRESNRWRVQVQFDKSDLRFGPDRDDRAVADADMEVVQAAGDRDHMRLTIQQLKTATVTQEMPPVTPEKQNTAEADEDESPPVSKRLRIPHALVHHDSRVIRLGKFARNWNHSRRCILVLVERQRIMDSTHALAERCRIWMVPAMGYYPVVDENPEIGASPTGAPCVLGPPTEQGASDNAGVIPTGRVTFEERYSAAWVRLFVSLADGGTSLDNQGVDIHGANYDILRPRTSTEGELAEEVLSVHSGSAR